MVTFYQVTFFHYRFRVYFPAQFSQLIVVVRWKVIGVVPHTTLPTFVCFPSPSRPALSSTDSAPLVGTLMYARDSIFIESSHGCEIGWKTLKENFLSIAKLLGHTQTRTKFRVLFVGSVCRKLFACGRGWSQFSHPYPNPLSINLVHMCGLPENCLTRPLDRRNRYLALRQAFTVCLLRRCGSFLFALTCGLCPRAKLGAWHMCKGGRTPSRNSNQLWPRSWCWHTRHSYESRLETEDVCSPGD